MSIKCQDAQIHLDLGQQVEGEPMHEGGFHVGMQLVHYLCLRAYACLPKGSLQDMGTHPGKWVPTSVVPSSESTRHSK